MPLPLAIFHQDHGMHWVITIVLQLLTCSEKSNQTIICFSPREFFNFSSLMEYEAWEKTIVEQVNTKLSTGSDLTKEKLILF